MFKSVLTLAKKISIGGLYFTACFVIAVVLFFQSNIPQDTLKQIIESQLEKQIGNHVSIGSVSGNFLKTVTLNDITLFLDNASDTRATINKLDINISILNALINKGNILFALDAVSISDVTLFLNRDLNGAFELASLAPKRDAPKANVHLTTRLEITDLNVVLNDARGWGKTPLNSPFKEVIHIDKASFNIDTAERSTLYVNGRVNTNNSDFTLFGDFNSSNLDYNLHFDFSALPLSHWSPYILPVQGISLSSNTAQISGELSSSTKHPDAKTPFGVSLKAKLNDNMLNLSFLPAPIQLKSGTVDLTHTITSNIPLVTFTDIKGTLSEIPFNGKGTIDLEHKTIDFFLASKQTEASHISTLFPSLSFLGLEGKAKGTLTIAGDLKNPELFGHASSPKITVFAETIDHMYLDYLYKNHRFYYTLHEGKLYNAPIKSKGKIDTHATTPEFSIDLSLPGLNLDQFIKLPQSQRIGTTTISSLIYGTPKTYQIDSLIESPEASFLNQKVPHISTNMWLSEDKLLHVEAEAKINTDNSLLKLSSSHLDDQLAFNLVGENLLIYDIEPSSNNEIPGQLSVSGSVTLQDTAPFQIVEASIIATSNNFPYRNAHYNRFYLDSDYSTEGFTINSITLENDEEQTNINGRFGQKTDNIIHLKFNRLNTKDNVFLQEFIPVEAKPFEGLISGDLWFIPQKNEQFLLNYNVSGNLTLENGKIQNQGVDKLDVVFSAQEKLTLTKFELNHKASILSLRGQVDEQAMTITINPTAIHLEDFGTFLFQYGTYKGQLDLSGSIQGPYHNPNINLEVNGQNLATSYMKLNKIKGGIRYHDGTLTVSNLSILDSHTDMILDGYIQPNPGNYPPFDYKFDVTVNKIDIAPFTQLIENSINEIESYSSTVEDIEDEVIPRSNITITNEDQAYEITIDLTKDPLFSLDSSHVLSHYQTVKVKRESRAQPITPTESSPLSGRLSGNLRLESRDSIIPKVDGTITIDNFHIPYFQSNSFDMSFNSKKGDVNYTLQLNDGILVSRPFNRINSSGSLTSDGKLTIQKASLNTESQINKNIIKGSLSLASFWDQSERNHPIDLTIALLGDDINILSFLHPSILSISNDGNLIFNISGPINSPIISASTFTLKNAFINFKNNEAIVDHLLIKSSNPSLQNNTFILPKTLLQWKNTSKDSSYSKMETHGSLELTSLSLASTDVIQLDTAFYTSATKFPIAIPEFYTGDVELSPMRFEGLYSIPMSEAAKKEHELTIKEANESGPVLTGRIALKNGSFELPKRIDSSSKPSYIYDLKIDIEKDTFMSGSFFGSGSLAGISADFELEETIQPLRISGTNNSPRVENRIQFKDGNINIFNRSFELLAYSEQAQYFNQVGGELLPNEIYFDNATNASGHVEFVPFINVSSATVVDPLEEDTSTSDITIEETEYSHVVSKISGPLNNLSTIRFDYFTSESDAIKNNNDITYIQSYYLSNTTDQNAVDQSDRTALLKVLLPELFGEGSDQILTEYGESRVNMIFKRSVLRPLEKQIAEGIGLYDLKIDYNLGSDLFNTTDSSSLGINMMQRLVSDQLFLRVKTDIELQSESRTNENSVGVSEVELTYFLRKNLSVNYANIRDDISTETNFKPKLSLKFSHEF